MAVVVLCILNIASVFCEVEIVDGNCVMWLTFGFCYAGCIC
jgi:hypothetical protein